MAAATILDFKKNVNNIFIIWPIIGKFSGNVAISNKNTSVTSIVQKWRRFKMEAGAILFIEYGCRFFHFLPIHAKSGGHFSLRWFNLFKRYHIRSYYILRSYNVKNESKKVGKAALYFYDADTSSAWCVFILGDFYWTNLDNRQVIKLPEYLLCLR